MEQTTTQQPHKNKTALVTGASRGIGRAIALRLAQLGATVGLHYAVGRDEAESLAAEIARQGGSAFTIRGDLSVIDGVEAIFKGLTEQLGPGQVLDILVNNAGRQIAEGPHADEAAFDYLFAINVKAAFFLIQRLTPILCDGGRIINISSGTSLRGFPEKMVYAMAKAATNSMTKSFAELLGPRKITVNAVLPGIIATDMNAWARSPQGAERVAALSVFNRVGQPEDIADVVAFLASEDSRWVTGELISAAGAVR